MEPLQRPLDHFYAGVLKRLLERLSEMSLAEMSVMKIPLVFTDQYNAAGAWGGIELPEDITMLPDRGGYPPARTCSHLVESFRFHGWKEERVSSGGCVLDGKAVQFGRARFDSGGESDPCFLLSGRKCYCRFRQLGEWSHVMLSDDDLGWSAEIVDSILEGI